MHGRYAPEAVQGLMSAGAASRLDAVKALAESVGGSVEWINWTFGGTGSYALMNLPDDAAAHAIALTASAGAGEASAIRLLTAEEVDESISRRAAFRPPGQ